MSKAPKMSVVRKANKLLWMHATDTHPGFWLDDLVALQAFTNEVLRQGKEAGATEERARVVAYLLEHFVNNALDGQSIEGIQRGHHVAPAPEGGER